MAFYESAREKLNEVDTKRENVDLDDFEEFMRKVEEVNKMVHALTSNNKSEIEEATQNAAAWLKTNKKEKRKDKEMVEEIINEPNDNFDARKRNYDKTVINDKVSVPKQEEEDLNNLNCETMSQEAFMRSVEADAKKRSEDRKRRQIESDALKENAKKAFLAEDYEKALDWYNKAIEVRKDSWVLYTNRALTLLYLGLNKRALDDCEVALRLDENNFKAFVYKGKAYFQMGDDEKVEEWFQEAIKMFPNRIEEIEEYKKSWNPSSENEEE